ncbi:hypothetical protein VTK73DRAFT_4374 [Phialemonium thermophilum]|uniref:PH domain-containing protein n=1 Tax=Phialemonium thermophilum TaxID=223376 RepID=A0ABR3Y0P9_9PEZI
MKAGSVRSLALQSAPDENEIRSAFYCPVPTAGNPTEVLAERFQAWRKILKDLIVYFREIQTHYEHRSKSLQKLANVLNGTTMPPGFLASGGLDDALGILRNYTKQVILESAKAKEIEEDVILALTGLRTDLRQKIKEIKNLSSDFKNSVDKEMDATRKAVNHLQEVLGQTELDPALTTGKQDPYLLRLSVDRQLERQIDEENYLHQAYLNLESSGRELESIVVGEIQKAYNAYAGILKREADAAYTAIEDLRVGPIAMPKDYEWSAFVHSADQLVDPEIPIRSVDMIHYPGRDHYACQEIRAGLLERKSKYLKSYTAGWYVLSPTHLHEFKSADKTQSPVMSLYLPEQKLGSHSAEGRSSNKFVLKGRQTGGLHRGHTWVFRAESHDTMMAWYEDIKALTEKSPQELSSFVRGHSRSFSRSSQRSYSSDGVVDEEDEEPFAAVASVDKQQTAQQSTTPRRTEPGGRFPSDLRVNADRGLQAPMSPSSISSDYNDNQDRNVIAAAAGLPGSGFGRSESSGAVPAAGGNVDDGATSAGIPAHSAAVDTHGTESRRGRYEAFGGATEIDHRVLNESGNHFTSDPVTRQDSSTYGNTYNHEEGKETANIGNYQPERSGLEPSAQRVDAVDARSYNEPGVTPVTQAETGSYIIPTSAGDRWQATSPSAQVNKGYSSLEGPGTDGSDSKVASANLKPVGSLNAQGKQHLHTEQYTVLGGNVSDSGAKTTAHLHIPGEYPKASQIG